MEQRNLHYAKYEEDPFAYLYATSDPIRSTNFEDIQLTFEDKRYVIFVNILEQQLDFILQVIDWCFAHEKKVALIPSVVSKTVLPLLKKHINSPERALELISTALAASGGWAENTNVGSMHLDYQFPCAFNETTLRFASYNTLLPIAQEIASQIRELNLSELESIIWIDNWMQQNIQYIKNRESEGPNGDGIYICDDITKQATVPDVLLHHYGTCEDIAVSVATIASLLGIDCAVIQGNKHAWNLVTLDDRTYILDSTRNITRNPNRMVDALKATKHTSQFTLVGADRQPADYAFLAGIGIHVSSIDFPRELVENAISKLKSKGVPFEYGTHVVCKSRRNAPQSSS